MPPAADATHHAISAVWRLEAAKVIAAVARLTHDVGVAEELAGDALVAALEHWPREFPQTGVPTNPGAWLTTTAKRRALDWLRHRAMAAAEHEALARDAQVALTLKLIGGLTTKEIARAFLVAEPTIAQRIVRAKRTLSEARVPFELPPREHLAERLAGVLEVIYLIFNEGYAATGGDDWMRPALCTEALRLARMLAAIAPGEPEVHGLQALLEIQASRTPARIDAQGQPVLLMAQDRARWDYLLIRRGLAALAQAESLSSPPARGPYTLQAAIAACHARATHSADTDWTLICTLYDALLIVQPSPVVELNRAVAVSRAPGPTRGPAVALRLVEALQAQPQLAQYHLLPSVHADLLASLVRHHEARAMWQRAADLTRNARERELLLARAHHTQPEGGLS